MVRVDESVSASLPTAREGSCGTMDGAALQGETLSAECPPLLHCLLYSQRLRLVNRYVQCDRVKKDDLLLLLIIPVDPLHPKHFLHPRHSTTGEMNR